MENKDELAQRLREVLLNGIWIANTNYKTTISDLSWKEATIKIGTLNSISLLTQHINYYLFGVLNVFEGGKLDIKDKLSFDFPEIQSQKDWKKILDDFFVNSEKLAKHIEKIPEDQLDKPFVNEKYGDYRRNIEAMIEHSYYHLGQISLLKKMIRL